jgi:hypothetical protein
MGQRGLRPVLTGMGSRPMAAGSEYQRPAISALISGVAILTSNSPRPIGKSARRVQQLRVMDRDRLAPQLLEQQLLEHERLKHERLAISAVAGRAELDPDLFENGNYAAHSCLVVRRLRFRWDSPELRFQYCSAARRLA